MKTIKLFSIFAFVLGGIIAILYFANRQDSTTIVVVDSHSLQQYREQFEEEWEAAGDWNEETFRNHTDLIRQLGANGYDVSSLYDLNTSTAVNVVYEHILSEWGNTTCKKQKVERYMIAVDTIVASEERASQNPSVKLIREINTIYQKAVDLASQSIGLSPRFDGNGWNSYEKYASRIESQKSSILDNDYYKRYLSNIQEIKNGLESIPSKLSSGRTRFYESLADCIMQHYSRVPGSERTRDELEHLRGIISRYKEEFHSVSSLDKFSSQYANDVTNNENRNESR